MFKGPIPEGYVVMHLCDNPPCANPEHLKAGTQNENIQDAVRKGRSNAPKNLTDEQVQEIRLRWRLGETQQKLEEDFNSGGGTVSRIMSGELYSKVPDTSADVAVNQEARVRSLDPEKKVALQECIKKKMSITEITSTIGVHHATIQKYYPGYGSWTWKAENTSLQSETMKCIFCGRVLTVQNLKRHQGSARCLKSRKEGR